MAIAVTHPAWITVITLGAGAIGAGVGYLLHFPAFLLTGPALIVSLLGLFGVALDVMPSVRNLAFLVLGVGVGATVDEGTTEALLRWPLAVVALLVMLVITMSLGQWVLRRWFGFDRRSAVLAAAPGHLSFVLSLGAEIKVDLALVAIAQSLRLLALTLVVPVLALALGIDIPANALAQEIVMPWPGFALLMAVALALGLMFLRFKIPAALLLGAMVSSGVAHGAGWSVGGLHPVLAAAAFVTLGTLIGARFSGIGWTAFRSALGAGLAATLVAVAVTVVVAVLMIDLLPMPLSTMLAAFAPGGFETMVALGAVLGANPGFVASCHVARLMILTGLIPLYLRLSGRLGRET